MSGRITFNFFVGRDSGHRGREQWQRCAKSNRDIGYAPTQASTPVPGCTRMPQKAGKLEGKWCRELPGCSVVATLAGDELKFCISEGVADNARICVTLTADYTLTKDGLVYGVFTGVDVSVKQDQKAAKVNCLRSKK